MRMSRRAVISKKNITLDAYTKSLLHFNGADGSTAISDDSGKEWTLNGASAISSSAKFGSGSYFSSITQNSWIDTPNVTDFQLGSGLFTIDFWVKRNRVSSGNFYEYVFAHISSSGQTTDSAISFYFSTDNKPVVVPCMGGMTYPVQGFNSVTADGIFHHIAIVRYRDDFVDEIRLYLDGVQQQHSSLPWGQGINGCSGRPTIGRAGAQSMNYFSGYIDEFRFSKGIARWTGNFTPPTSEYAL